EKLLQSKKKVCLVEGAGDVAFIKHTIIPENSTGPVWACDVKSEDYELICPEKGPAPVSNYLSCNLARVAAHAVVTRPVARSDVINLSYCKQAKFGNSGNDENGKNLLFKDSTKCLQQVQDGQNDQQFLGSDYNAMFALAHCSETTPG
uniref:Transferrin-like domain-containing protein n=1 Tax=Gouania willdenowi TaxID=441366 RepID=A0A8C5NB46_GOUWI